MRCLKTKVLITIAPLLFLPVLGFAADKPVAATLSNQSGQRTPISTSEYKTRSVAAAAEEAEREEKAEAQGGRGGAVGGGGAIRR